MRHCNEGNADLPFDTVGVGCMIPYLSLKFQILSLGSRYHLLRIMKNIILSIHNPLHFPSLLYLEPIILRWTLI